MTNIPTITIVFVTLAAILICRRELAALVSGVGIALTNHYLNGMGKLHQKAGEELVESFDFWWSDGPADTVGKGIKRTAPIPDEMRVQVEKGFAHMDVSAGVAECYGKALHLALHAKIRDEEHALLATMPRIYGIRSKVTEQRAEHEKSLDADRMHLIQLGLDVDKMEEYFSPSTSES